jgi:hydrogenase maturation protease
MSGARVIGLGQRTAGDDGVGLAVLEALARRGVPAGVELVQAAEESALVDLVETPLPVVLVDAVLGTPAGEVVTLAPEELESHRRGPVSTHGLGVPRALALARAVAGARVAPAIHVVGITIARAEPYGPGLSPAVAAAVPRAAERVLALVERR